MLNNFDKTTVSVFSRRYEVRNCTNTNWFEVNLNNGKYLQIIVEGKGNGSIYFKPLYLYDEKTARRYSSDKYLIKYIPLTREVAFALRQINAVWDYVDDKVLEPVKEN